MIDKLSALLRRVDVLLIGLALAVSYLLVSYYGSPAAVAVVEDPPQLFPPSEQQSAPPDSAEPEAPRALSPVRFMMYNVQNYFLEEDKPRSRHARRIKTVQERENTADVIASAKPQIVGLIEMGGPAALNDLAERLAARGLRYPHRKVLTRWGEDRALAILSMHPIVEDHSKADCDLVGQTNRRMLRGILDVTVKLKDKRQYRILGVHLKARVGDNPVAAQALRAREARTLAAHVQQVLRTRPSLPLLVFGDWNDGPADPALAVMTQGSSRDTTLQRLKPEDARGESWTIYYKEGNEYSTFDQIYVNKALKKRMGNKAEMGIVSEEARKHSSDHRAVWCDLL